MNSKKVKGRRRSRKGSFKSKRKANTAFAAQLISLSKTKEMGQAIETEHLSELTEEEFEVSFRATESSLKGFVWLDARYLMPFFTRRFTEQEVKDCKSAMTDLTNRWYDTLRRPDTLSEENGEDDEDDEDSDGEDLFDAYQRGENIGMNNNNNNNFDDDGCYPADDEEGRIGTKSGKFCVFKFFYFLIFLFLGTKSKPSVRQSTSQNKKSSLSKNASLDNQHTSGSNSAKAKLLPTRNAVYKKLSNASSSSATGSASLSTRSSTASSQSLLRPSPKTPPGSGSGGGDRNLLS